MRLELLTVFAFCSLALGNSGPPDTLKFSHKTHIQDIGAKCIDCHVSLSEKGKPAVGPVVTEATCKKCHDNKTADFECKICHTNSNNVAVMSPTTLPVRFSHARHVDSSATCTPCHKGLESVAIADKKNFPTMKTCQTCHDDRKAPSSCAVCHIDLAAIKPVSHDEQWLDVGGHGYQARFPNAECSNCHQTSYCNQCHQGNTPTKIHNPGYEFEHGLDVKQKTMDCTVCHETSSMCLRCHGGK